MTVDVAELRSLLKKWLRKTNIKYSTKIINYVYRLVSEGTTNKTAIAYINSTGFFKKYLWEFYQDGVSSAHTDLVAIFLMYDLKIEDQAASQRLMDLFLDEQYQSKYQSYMANLTSKPNSYMLDLLTVLISTKLAHPTVRKNVGGIFSISNWRHLPNYEDLLAHQPDYIQDSFQRKIKAVDSENLGELAWLYDVMVTQAKNQMMEGKDDIDTDYEDNEDTLPTLVSSLINLLIVCLSQLPIRTTLNTFVKEIGFISALPRNEHTDLLRYYVYYPIDDFSGEEQFETYEKDRADRFYKLQLTWYDIDEGNPIHLLPSVYNTNPEEVSSWLRSLTLASLQQILANLKVGQYIPTELISNDLLVKIIVDSIYTPNYNTRQIVLEKLVFSDVSQFSQYTSPFPPLIGTIQYLSTKDYIFRTLLTYAQQYRQEAVTHILLVLQRMAVSSEGLAKGSSKYATSIKSISNDEGKIKVELVKDLSIISGDSVVLVQILKPNKYSEHQVTVQHGVSVVRSGRVISTDKRKILALELDGHDQGEVSDQIQFSHIIKLPVDNNKTREIANKGLHLNLPPFLKDLFLGFDHPNSASYTEQANRPVQLKINCLNGEELVKEIYGAVESEKDVVTKKLKADDVKDTISPGDSRHSLLLRFPEDSSLETTFSILDDVDTVPEAPMCKLAFEGLVSSISTGLTLIDTPPYLTVPILKSILHNLHLNFPNERVLVVSLHISATEQPISEKQIVLVGDKQADTAALKSKADQLLIFASKLFQRVINVAEALKAGEDPSVYGQSCEDAWLLFRTYIEPSWEKFLINVKESPNNETLSQYPFDMKTSVNISNNFQQNLKSIISHYIELSQVFYELNSLNPVIKFQDNFKELFPFIVNKYCTVIHVSEKFLLQQFSADMGPVTLDSLNLSSIILTENEYMSEFRSLSTFLTVNDSKYLKRVVILGNTLINRKSLILRFVGLQVPTFGPLEAPLVRSQIAQFYSEQSPRELNPSFNSGFDKVVQYIEVEKSTSHVNVEEVEYLVAVYQYMRLLNYPADTIAILTASAIQRVLLCEVLTRRCGPANEPASDKPAEGFNFGWPQFVLTTKDLQNSKADYVLLSTHGEELQEVISSVLRASLLARLGLYVFTSADVTIEKCSSLKIRVGELYNRDRSKQSFTIENREHMADYVEQMTKTRRGAK